MVNDKRLCCLFCRSKTWMQDYVAFMKGHDRPDGRTCRAAQRAAFEHVRREERNRRWKAYWL